MAPSRGGRPRASGPSALGLTTRQDILRAAAHAFCTRGFGSQSTYAICRAAGVTQGSLYHYFANKHEILLELLLSTVEPSVEFAEHIYAQHESALVRLWALCSFDANLFAANELNIGMLYLLPEAGDPEVERFRIQRDRLIDVYRSLISQCPAVTDDHVEDVTAMVVALIESIMLIRRQDQNVSAELITTRIADTALGLVGVRSDEIEATRAAGMQVRESIEYVRAQKQATANWPWCSTN